MLRLTLLLMLLCLADYSRADLIVTVGNGDGQTTPWGTFTQGTTGVSIPFFIEGDSTIDAYKIAIDFLGDGYNGDPSTGNAVDPPGFSNFGADFSNGPVLFGGSGNFNGGSGGTAEFYGQIAAGGNPAAQPNFDFVVNHSGGMETPTTQQKLFDLSFDIDAGAAPGVYDVLFVVRTDPISLDNETEFSLGSAPVTTTVTAFQGSFEVAAVPEPSSLVGIAALAGIGVLRRRRKR
ncbi:MAG TPA: hypothetical protein DDW52_21280 [Planctomycetaceae bacterium]|nr:hypothetical protein [Planctomycetaceae bacterium]